MTPAHAIFLDIQSDQFHYFHHRFFTCNYGSASFPLDNFFGTFKSTGDWPNNAKSSTSNKSSRVVAGTGVGDPTTEAYCCRKHKKTPGKADITPSNILQGCNKVDHLLYSASTAMVFALAAHELVAPTLNPSVVAVIVSFGPIILGCILHLFGRSDKSMFWPFHNGAWFGAFGLHILIGLVVSALPVYHVIKWSL